MVLCFFPFHTERGNVKIATFFDSFRKLHFTDNGSRNMGCIDPEPAFLIVPEKTELFSHSFC